MQTAKVFKNGQSQAVRLPKEFRVKGSEVYIKKQGNLIILIPQDTAWDSLIESLEEFSDDCFSQSRIQPECEIREDFDL